jgi:hypothetical protein
MVQAVTAIFRMYYVSRIISRAIWATDKNAGPILNVFWNGCIWNSVNNTGDTWDEINESTVNLLLKVVPRLITKL